MLHAKCWLHCIERRARNACRSSHAQAAAKQCGYASRDCKACCLLRGHTATAQGGQLRTHRNTMSVAGARILKHSSNWLSAARTVRAALSPARALLQSADADLDRVLASCCVPWGRGQCGPCGLARTDALASTHKTLATQPQSSAMRVRLITAGSLPDSLHIMA